MIFILSSFCVVIFIFIVAKKIDFIKYPNGQICLLKGHFWVFWWHFCLFKIRLILDFSTTGTMSQQFFYGRYHQNSTTGTIYKRLLIETSNIIKTAFCFILVFWSSFIGLVISYQLLNKLVSKLSVISYQLLMQ